MKEKQRNEEILRVLRPQLLLLGAELPPDAAELLPERFAGRTLRLAELRPLGASARSPRGAPKRGLLCFQLTGGTTGLMVDRGHLRVVDLKNQRKQEEIRKQVVAR